MRIDVVLATSLGDGPADAVRRARMLVAARPGTELRIRIPAGAPTSITTSAEDAAATPGVLSEIAAAENDGADAVIVNCTADTGVVEARKRVAIPVIGVSETAFHRAAELSERFSVLTFAERIAPRFEAMAVRWGMADRLASVRSVEMPLEEIDDFGLLAAALLDQAAACVLQDGAQVVVLGCTDFENAAGLVEEGLAARGIGVPLLRPYDLGLREAEMLVDGRMRVRAGA